MIVVDLNEVTTGELYRQLQSMDKKLDRMHTDMVGRGEYEADQKGINIRFTTQNDAITKNDIKVSAIEAELKAEIKDIRTSLDATEKEQRQNRAKWVFALVMAGATPIIGILVSIMLRGAA